VALVAAAEPSREVALSILRHARGRLAPFKRVRRLEIVPGLPKTISGKIRRVQLRQAERGEPDGGLARGQAYAEEDFPELRGEEAGG
jgi:acetyl-CoA synthetase